jgi:hypothetical protein
MNGEDMKTYKQNKKQITQSSTSSLALKCSELPSNNIWERQKVFPNNLGKTVTVKFLAKNQGLYLATLKYMEKFFRIGNFMLFLYNKHKDKSPVVSLYKSESM